MFGKSPILFSNCQTKRDLLSRFFGGSYWIPSSIRVTLLAAILVVTSLCPCDHLSFYELSPATVAFRNVVLLFLVPELYRVGPWLCGLLRPELFRPHVRC